jgi:hypothetical protein
MFANNITRFADVLKISEFIMLSKYPKFLKCKRDQEYYERKHGLAPPIKPKNTLSTIDSHDDDFDVESLLKSSSPNKKQKINFGAPMTKLNTTNE